MGTGNVLKAPWHTDGLKVGIITPEKVFDNKEREAPYRKQEALVWKYSAQWESIVGEIKRVLRPGGLCVIFEHNPWNPATRWIVNRCEFDADAVLLSHRKAAQLMIVNGFEDISSQHILTVPIDAGWARTLDKAFGRIPVGAQYYTVGRALS